MIIEFYDEDAIYGRIETEEDFYKIKQLTERYKKENQEDYNIDDLYLYLEKKEIKFKILQIETDRSIYF